MQGPDRTLEFREQVFLQGTNLWNEDGGSLRMIDAVVVFERSALKLSSQNPNGFSLQNSTLAGRTSPMMPESTT